MTGDPGGTQPPAALPARPEALRTRLDQLDYLVDDGLAMALFLALTMGQPLLLEGEPGVGKTTAAKAMAAVVGTPLIRLQCYEGISAAEALYEWNYPRQLLAIRQAEANGRPIGDDDLFSPAYLLERPLLRAVTAGAGTGGVGPPAVLLVDEIDRADDEFEALLLEFLGEASVTVPELGTFTAARRPVVILTSNRTRELHDALKRRCFYHWIDYPSLEQAAAIVRRRVPAAADPIVTVAATYVARARSLDLDKPPGLAEAIDWVSALQALGISGLDRRALDATIGAIAKTPDDLAAVRADLATVSLDEVGRTAGAADGATSGADGADAAGAAGAG